MSRRRATARKERLADAPVTDLRGSGSDPNRNETVDAGLLYFLKKMDNRYDDCNDKE
jgi:hypothetical protein